jgi:predicted small metal-binding protein
MDMAKVVYCRDAGVDCDFVARGKTVEDVLKQCMEHGRKAHDMKEISPDLEKKIRSLIREEAA